MNEFWSIPTRDLEKIYKSMNITSGVSALEIRGCTMLMYVGSLLEKHFSSLLTFRYDTHSSFLTEDLDLWFHGGFEDMGTNVAWKWA